MNNGYSVSGVIAGTVATYALALDDATAAIPYGHYAVVTARETGGADPITVKAFIMARGG